MFMELKRLIDNLVSYGTVTETKSNEGKALARVQVMDRVTDFLPIVSFSNSFKRHFTPTRVGEQVVVISPFGEASSGFIIRSIFHTSSKEPDLANDTTEVMEYEDGTVISYDTSAKELKIDASKSSGKITILCDKADVKAATDVNVEADKVKVDASTVDVIADSVLVDSPSIDLGGTGGKGVVTGDCICAFTGNPHPDVSSITKSVK